MALEIVDDPATLDRYSRDWSLFQVVPKGVVFPKNTEDIKSLVAYAITHKISLTARAGGSDMSGGPLGEGIIVDFTNHMNRLIEIGQDYAVVQPGMYYRDFEKETLKYGLLFPPYPASKNLAAIGGIVANNSGGEKSLAYGKTEKYVKEIKMVCNDGEERIFKKIKKEEIHDSYSQQVFDLIEKNYDLIKQAKPNVHKNSAGYALWNVWDREDNIFDMTQLIVGSQGTLGLITEVKIGLIRPKQHSVLLVIFLKDLAPLAKLVSAVLKHHPESFESYDDTTFRIAIRFMLSWRFLPEFWLAVTGGIPKMVLMAEFTGDTEEEAYQYARSAEAEIRPFRVKTHVANNNADEGKYWSVRRGSFKLLTDHSKGKRTAPFIDDVVVNPEHLPEFLPKLQEIMSHYDLTFTIAGHIGEGNFHIIPLVKIGDQRLAAIVPELSEKVFDLVARYHGSITGEHNDGLVRTPYLGKMFSPEVLALFAETKKIFDPAGIFNPRKKVSGDIHYALEHLRP